MSTQVKQRIIGGLVLLALLAIFLPLFFSNPHPSAALLKPAPNAPSAPRVELQLPRVADKAEQNDSMDQLAAKLINDNPDQAAQIPAAVKDEAAPVSATPKVAPSQVPMKVAVKKQALPPVVSAKTKTAATVVQHYHQLVKTKAWVVQLASFSNQSNAKRLMSKLRASGYKVYVRQQKTSSGRKVHQVLVGPEISHQRIQEVQKKLQGSYRMKGIIRRYQA